MKLFDLLKLSFSNLFRRKARTALTVSGVVIGTCSIIVMISLGVGLSESTLKSIEDMGDLTCIDVYAWGAYNPDNTEQVQPPPLDDSAADYIRSLSGVTAVSPFYQPWGVVEIKSGKYVFEGQVIGVDISALQSFGYETSIGGFPDSDSSNATLLFGEKAGFYFIDPKKREKHVWPEYDPNTWEIINQPDFDVMSNAYVITPKVNETDDGGMIGFEKVVVSTSSGIVIPDDDDDGDDSDEKSEEEKEREHQAKLDAQKSKKIKAFPAGQLIYSRDKYETLDSLFIDVQLLKNFEAQYNKINNIEVEKNAVPSYDRLKVKCSSIDDVSDVLTSIKDLGYETWNPSQYLDQAKEQMFVIQMVLGALGCVSLFVAAIGITNTMVMSIYERTREIGIMKVLGCKIGNIRKMFLVEAAAIGLLGGVIGIALSYGLSFGINIVVGSMSEGGGGIGGIGGGIGAMSQISVIPFWLVLLGVLFSIVIGLVSGFYPANRAVKVSALSAIRQD